MVSFVAPIMTFYGAYRSYNGYEESQIRREDDSGFY